MEKQRETLELIIDNDFGVPSAKIVLFAKVMVSLDSFIGAVIFARHQINLKSLVIYPLDANIEEKLDVLLSLGLERSIKVEQDAYKIANTYNLTQSWIKPIQLAVMTGTLPIPNDPPIEIMIPSKDIASRSLTKSEFSRLKEKAVILIIHREISPRQLKEFVSSPEVTRSVRKLPSVPSFRESNELVIFWGKVAEILRIDYADSKNKGNAWITRLNALKDMKLNDKELQIPDTTDELISYHTRYLKLKDKLDSKSK